MDKKHYKEIKKFVLLKLSTRPALLADKITCPVEWAKTFFPLISDCAAREDYEAAQGTKDAIIEFLNKFGAELPKDVEFKLPEYKILEAHGIICFGKKGDLSGMGSGGAMLF